jgi:hypothetical protein
LGNYFEWPVGKAVGKKSRSRPYRLFSSVLAANKGIDLMRLRYRPKPKLPNDANPAVNPTFNSMRDYLARSRARRSLFAVAKAEADSPGCGTPSADEPVKPSR